MKMRCHRCWNLAPYCTCGGAPCPCDGCELQRQLAAGTMKRQQEAIEQEAQVGIERIEAWLSEGT